MKRIVIAAVSAPLVVTACSGSALAADRNVTSKKMQVKDPSLPDKQQIQAQSMDASIVYADAVSPDTTGGWVHVYSSTHDYCAELEAGADWTTNGKTWKYKNKITLEQVQLTAGKLQIKLKGSLGFDLNLTPQGSVNVVALLGEDGSRLCMHCAAPFKDTDKLFSAKDCTATACDSIVDTCLPAPGPVSSSTTLPPAPSGLQGALPASTGRFTYTPTVGLVGANDLCDTKFPGTHACSYAELQAAEASHQLAGLKDSAPVPQTVTSFWAIDSTHSAFLQCAETVPWDYETAHTGHMAEHVLLTNATGVLGSLVSNSQCGSSRWVGCCLP